MHQTACFYPVFFSLLKAAGRLTFFQGASRGLGNSPTLSNFYRGRAFASLHARRPYPNFFTSSLRQSTPLQFNLDGFFFPYKTHGGYSFRPLGLFTNPQPVSNLSKTPKLSFSKGGVSSRFAPRVTLSPSQLFTKSSKLPPRLLAATVRRRKRRAWLTRWVSAPLAATQPLFKSSRAALSWDSRPPLKPLHTSSWFLEAARFKPGLSTEWRKSRLAFNYAWGLNFLRQRRLTRFFLRLKGLGGFSFLRLITLSAGHVLLTSFTAFCGASLGGLTLASWACRLNGRLVTNPFVQLFSGDVLQLLSLKPAAPAWTLKLSHKKFNAFLRDQFALNKASSFLADVPGFLEVDELTLTSVVLGNPDFKALLPSVQAGPAPYLTFRLYNWKYTT